MTSSNIHPSGDQLIIIGKGSEEFKLKKFVIENDLGEKIKFLGYKKNPFKYLKQADILILTSIFEGSPNVLLEAITLKKFVISSDCPTGPREILDDGKGGILFKIGDYKMLSKKIIFYIKNKRQLNKKKIYAFKRLNRFDYKNRLKEYYKTINF